MTTAAAIVVALAAALCFALTSALQHHAAASQSQHAAGDPRLLLRLARQPVWLASNGLDLVGTALQALALHWGTLVAIQPLLLCSILFALPIEAGLRHRRLKRREMTAALTGVLGLVVLLVTIRPTAGTAVPSVRAWILIGVVVVVAVAAALGYAAGRGPAHGARRALALGTATGILYGVTAALLKTCTQWVHDPLQLLVHWQTAALVVAGVGGFLLNQNAFQGATLAPGLLAISLAEPVTAVVLGATAYGEHIPASVTSIAGGVVAIAAVVASLWLLAGTPLRSGPPGDAA